MAEKNHKRKAKAKPQPKPRANKYEDKLQINGSFEDLVKELITPNEPMIQKPIKK
jgi:hypothetical protein